MSGVANDSAMTALQDAFLTGLETAQQPAWLAQSRTSAMQGFIALGLPTRDDEAWRFTDLRPLFSAQGLPAPASAAGADPLQSSISETIDLRPDLIQAAFEAEHRFGEQPFASLNAALFADGFVLALEPGVVLEHPVEILHLSDAADSQAYHVRNAILAGANSAASVVETFVGSGPGWTNAVTTIDIGADAVIRHAKVQAEGAEAIHLAVTRARLADAADYDSFSLITGARLSRQDIQVMIAGEAATVQINAAYLLRNDQEATIAPAVDHQAKGGHTKELLKGVLTDRAHGVFLGSVMVREGADGTDARQLNRNLLASPTARVDTKPELTIHADEVKCSHGATVGDLDETALFYLESRGIDPASARAMLIDAFAAEVLEVAALAPDIDAHARRYLAAWLEHDGAAA